MQLHGLLDALERVPRRSLGTYPTPLVHLENLSRELGRAVYVKRDDTVGPVCGGNKTRKLEYLLADAIEAGATKIVTVGGPQSNHARLTAAAARMLGLEPHLLLIGIDVASIWESYPDLVARIANDALELLGLPSSVEPSDVSLIERTYVGRGYAVPTKDGTAAIRRLARSEGLLLDPSYTGKAFAGLLDLHASGPFGDEEPVIFWHTGGLPGLFAERLF